MSLAALDSVPKVDKGISIKSFVQLQKSYAPIYAAEGQAEFRSWNSELTGKKTPAKTTKGSNFGFRTPVLKPRTKPVVLSPKRSRSRELIKDGQSTKLKPEEQDDNPAKQPKAPKRKRAEKIASDDEHTERLAERRERKRAKKAVVQPNTVPEASKRTKQKPTNKSKIPAGLALMNGFSATNVGKNRITIQSTSNLGVFQKGRASAKTQIAKSKLRKTVTRATHFSEETFLKGRTKPSISISSSSSSSSAPPEIAESDKEIASPEPLRRSKAKDPHNVMSSPNDLLSDSASEYPTARSEVWDIELEGFVLPSHAPVVDSPSSVTKQPKERQRDASPEPSSLHPSQSASQCLPATSKYFTSLPISAPSPPPAPADSVTSRTPPIVELPEGPHPDMALPGQQTDGFTDCQPESFGLQAELDLSPRWSDDPQYDSPPNTRRNSSSYYDFLSEFGGYNTRVDEIVDDSLGGFQFECNARPNAFHGDVSHPGLWREFEGGADPDDDPDSHAYAFDPYCGPFDNIPDDLSVIDEGRFDMDGWSSEQNFAQALPPSWDILGLPPRYGSEGLLPMSPAYFHDEFDEISMNPDHDLYDDEEPTNSQEAIRHEAIFESSNDGYTSSDEDPDSVQEPALGYFSQGRELLWLGMRNESAPRAVTDVEFDVAKGLNTHWMPQRF